ncbi:MAG: hypothetical protein J0653_08445 [Deltaproteobacteria bacterium]|nr:hypothetical protein [Deltaproteobacteria bacterium]
MTDPAPDAVDVEKILTATLSRVIDFLKYAEAKNAALLTFASAWILATASLLTGGKQLPFHLDIALQYAVPAFGLAALIAIWSFIPKVKLNRFDKTALRARNYLYFSDIADVATTELLATISERYSEGGATSYYMKDLAIQLAVNSQIVKRKFAFFAWGAYALLLGIAIIVVTLAYQCWIGVAP